MTLVAPIPALTLGVAPATISTAPAHGPVERLSVEDTAARLYDAEINLHHARQSCIDVWVSAAYDHLHRAIEAHARSCR